jgi:drug/metabolite transporter (DMT)-like permease
MAADDLATAARGRGTFKSHPGNPSIAGCARRASAGSVDAVPPLACVLGAAVAFASASVLARRAYELGSSPASLLGVRLLVAALALSGVTSVRGRWRPTRRDSGVGAAAGAAFAAAGLGEFEALARAPAPAVVLLVFVAPVWIVLGSWAAGRGPPGWPVAAALSLIVGGLALLLGVPGGAGLGAETVALALGASVASAFFFALMADVTRRAAPSHAACIAASAAAVVTAAVQPSGIASELARRDTALLGIAIGCLTAVGLALLATGLREGTALWGSAVIGVEPLAAAALSAILLDELLAVPQLAGGAAVLFGVTVISVVSGPEPPSPVATGRTRPPRRGSRPPPRPARSARRRRSEGRWRGSRG